MAYKDPTDPRSAAAKLRHYHANKHQYLRRNAEKKARLRELLNEAKSKPCMDCGGGFPPECMDFDHRPGEVKLYDPTRLPRTGSLKALLAEIAKCDLVCANCHRIRTRKRRDEAMAATQPPKLLVEGSIPSVPA